MNCNKCSILIKGKMLSSKFYGLEICTRCAASISEKDAEKIRILIRGKKDRIEPRKEGKQKNPCAPRGFWNFQKAVIAAKESGSISAMIKKHPGATAWAYGNKMATRVFSEAGIYSSPHNKCVYLWKAGVKNENGKHLVKVGITSVNIGMDRILAVACPYGFTPEVVFISNATDKAIEIERVLLAIGDIADMERGDGYTEFRWMDCGEMEKAKAIAES